MPKALIVGQAGQFNLEGLVSGTLSQLGWDVARLNIYEKITNSSKLNDPIRMMATRSYNLHTIIDGIAGLERKVISSVRSEQPDLLIVFKGEVFPPKAAHRINHEFGTKTVLWFPDDPRFLNSLLLPIAPAFDFVVVSSNSTLAALRQVGVTKALHLSFACDPKVHRTLDIEKNVDLTFVGDYYPERARMLAKLTGFNLRIWGRHWNMPWIPGRLRQHVATGNSYGERYIEILNSSKITINVHHRSDLAAIGKPNMRVFEAAGCGAFMLTDEPPGLRQEFTPNHEIVCYGSAEELVDLARFYLDAEGERMNIAKAAQQRAYKEHTYFNRVAILLRRLGLPSERVDPKARALSLIS